jgi:hypothetical protein
MKRRNIQLRTFRCPECGAISTAPKMQSKMTGIDHRKDMWCWGCQQFVVMIQTDSALLKYSL